jgi:hypothetical protein
MSTNDRSDVKAVIGIIKRRRLQSFITDPSISYIKREPVAPSTRSLIVSDVGRQIESLTISEGKYMFRFHIYEMLLYYPLNYFRYSS